MTPTTTTTLSATTTAPIHNLVRSVSEKLRSPEWAARPMPASPAR